MKSYVVYYLSPSGVPIYYAGSEFGSLFFTYNLLGAHVFYSTKPAISYWISKHLSSSRYYIVPFNPSSDVK